MKKQKKTFTVLSFLRRLEEEIEKNGIAKSLHETGYTVSCTMGRILAGRRPLTDDRVSAEVFGITNKLHDQAVFRIVQVMICRFGGNPDLLNDHNEKDVIGFYNLFANVVRRRVLVDIIVETIQYEEFRLAAVKKQRKQRRRK